MNTALKKLEDNNTHIMNHFRMVCEEIASMARQENVLVVPYSNPSLPFYKLLEPHKRQEVLESIEIYASILRNTLQAGHQISESKQLSWNAFKMMKLKPTSDFFNHIADHLVVEIYTSTGIQVFRNFKFFEICSYTLEDLYCRPWFELYERDSKVVEAIGMHVGQVLSGKQINCYFPSIGVHSLNEIDSPFKYKLELEIDCLAPVTDENGDTSGYFAAIERVNILNKLTAKQKNKFLESYYIEKQQQY